MCKDCSQDSAPIAPALSRRQLLLLGASLTLAACSQETPPPPNTAPPPPPVKPPRPPIPDLGAELFPDPSGSPMATAADAPVIVLPRSAWTSAKPDLSDINVMGHVDRITVHHTGMKTDYKSTNYKFTVSDIENIRDFHTTDNQRKWADIAYHYIIDPAGRVWQGRPLVYQGAHTKLANEHNMGVVVMGDFENQFPAAVQLTTLAAFLTFVRTLYKVPVSRLYTHGELKSTGCPGKNLQSYMNRARTLWASLPS